MRRSSILTWDQLRVGALLLAALGILGFAVYKLGESAKLFSKHYTLVTFLANANGLRTGGPVTVAGQLAGSIRSIEFLPVDTDTTRNLRIVIDMDEELQSQVRADSRVTLQNQGLLGDKSFDIKPGTPRFRILHEGDTLLVGPSVDYEAMIQQASKAMTDVAALAHAMSALTDSIAHGQGTIGQLLTSRQIYDQFNTVLGNTSALLARLQNPHGSVGRLLNDPTLYENLTRVIASIDTITTALHTGNGTAAKLLRDDSLYNNLVQVTSRTDSLVTTMAHGNGTASKLFTDSQLYDQLVQAVAHINAILVDLQRDPKRYMKGAVKLF
ncbi:MAG TPA: MlaD family protein [Gemmatimonadaceae bacterium]|jgi:phospholipid/cholesterol/gamma-HCH transport system substrate-binding protein|nr:MlaD family protein [Gemmatimonadaceae bacterium]